MTLHAARRKRLAALMEQLRIDVAPAPNAVGRWTLDHEVQAYREALGEEALRRQQQLAREARECTCGEQEKVDAAAAAKGETARKLLGHQHKPGCNSFRKSEPKLAPRISASEQQARYEEERRVSQLRDALARRRAEEDA